MPTQQITPLDQQTAERLSAAYHQCYEAFEADPELFTDDAFFDLMPPHWRFQIQGASAFVTQLRAIAAERDITVEVLRTVPTATGFVTEHVETQRGDTVETARRVHVCEVRGGRIAEVTVYCNGAWDEELRARHAAEAPMLRS